MRSRKGSGHILVLNCGSSSLKYKIIAMPEEREIVSGEAERVGIKTQGTASVTHTVLGARRVIKADLPDHTAALKQALSMIREDAKEHKDVYFDAFAHRYVHPGRLFSKTTLVTGPVIKKLKETLELAPIHNPISFGLVEFCDEEYKRYPQYVIFDTAFHKTIPDVYASYALPLKLAKKYGLRKVGFHGISHKYVMHEAARSLGRDYKTQKIISCHLGTGGSSVCAIRDGRSINNSMGFTPLEGLMMNTRSGDLDLGVVLYIMFKENISPENAEEILNKKSGVLGVFNRSSDLRDAIGAMKTDAKADMAFNMYVKRVRSYIGFYSLILKKADILIFTDSLGAGVPVVRERICHNLESLGIAIDKDKNNSYAKGTADISLPDSGTRILVVPTDEEIMIAREAHKEMT